MNLNEHDARDLLATRAPNYQLLELSARGINGRARPDLALVGYFLLLDDTLSIIGKML